MSCKLILYTQTSYAHAVLQRINRDRPYVVGLQFFNLICRAILGLEGYRELKKTPTLFFQLQLHFVFINIHKIWHVAYMAQIKRPCFTSFACNKI